MDAARARPLAGRVARLLAQLALRAGQHWLAGVELSGGKLDEHLAHRVPVLPLEHDPKPTVSAFEQRHHHDGARVHEVFALRQLAIGQPHAVTPRLQEMAAEHRRAIDARLDQVAVGVGIGAHGIQPRRIRYRNTNPGNAKVANKAAVMA